MEYHDFAGATGRVPKLQEWFSLVADVPAEAEEWVCIVTFPNQSASATKRRAESVSFRVDEQTGRCEVLGISDAVDQGRAVIDFASHTAAFVGAPDGG